MPKDKTLNELVCFSLVLGILMSPRLNGREGKPAQRQCIDGPSFNKGQGGRSGVRKTISAYLER
jgi:hypothetical protein